MSECLAIRQAVLGEGVNEMDARAIHALLYDDEHKPVATGRLYIDNEGYWRLDSVCVRQDMQRKQLGDLVMRMILDKAMQAGARMFRLTTPLDVKDFFLLYGFEAYAQQPERLDMEATDESIVKAVFSGCRGEQFI